MNMSSFMSCKARNHRLDSTVFHRQEDCKGSPQKPAPQTRPYITLPRNGASATPY